VAGKTGTTQDNTDGWLRTVMVAAGSSDGRNGTSAAQQRAHHHCT